MRFDRLAIVAVIAVVALSAAVPLTLVSTAPSHEEKPVVINPFESISIYVFFGNGDQNNILPNTDERMTGAGSSVSSVIENAFDRTDGYEVELLATGAVKSVNGVNAPNGKAWVIFQWIPPEGWTAVTPGVTADAGMVENTSYLVALTESRESAGKVTYTVPDVEGPKSMAVFLLVCSTDQWGVDTAQLGEGEEGIRLAEKLGTRGGLCISGYGSNAAEALADACRKTFGWDGPITEGGALILNVPESRTEGLSEDQKVGLEMGTGKEDTIAGWLGNFMGLKDVILYDSFIYWNQYSWSDEEYKWGYNGYCLGYYDPAVTKYFGLAYTESAMVEEGDDTYSPFRGIDPHDFVPE